MQVFRQKQTHYLQTRISNAIWSRSPLVALTIIWFALIYWNERLVFSAALKACDWKQWEKWTANARPHHLVLIADPQLVDPHTYPGRPWPLSSLTIKYTDLYLRRVHRLLHHNLYPDTTVFLGDLFDGGREWSTGQSSSPETRYRSYGEAFWHQEYIRFTNIFLDTWREAGISGRTDQSTRRKIIINIPGNHDLGFASGIQEPVRKRFNAYFGDGNDAFIVGNHTFVTVDTVSLSAKDDPNASKDIWAPAQQFLDDYQLMTQRPPTEYLGASPSSGAHSLMPHTVVEGSEMANADRGHRKSSPSAAYPTVLLSHVPLYRDKGTPCGPLRERWPPSREPEGQYVDFDERNAISVSRGYQYQNVLSPEVSEEITGKLQPISYAFSGDDHDYCEVVHKRYPSAGSGIREITVKSLSWAMGVRRPGFQLVSLWNPQTTSSATLQSRLCLLPDQLSLFISYLQMLAFTILITVVQSAFLAVRTKLGMEDLVASDICFDLHPVKGKEAAHGLSSSSNDGSRRTMVKRGRLAHQSAQESGYRALSPSLSLGDGTTLAHDLENQAFLRLHVRDHYTSSPRMYQPVRSVFSSFQHWDRHDFAVFAREMKLSFVQILLAVGPWYFWLIRSDW